MEKNLKGEVMSCVDSNNRAIDRQNKPVKNLIRSKYANIMIKVDEDIYHLDRLQLACKSDYFEKLFIEDFREKKVDYLEFSVMDSDTFSTIVDIIYGQELKSLLDADNYVLLLMAMDYLQMKVDQKVYGEFIENFIQKKPTLDLNLFSLCEYLAENKNYDELMQFVYTCLSAHFAEVRDHQEFLSLPLDHVVGIVSGQRLNYSNINDIRQCSRVCVKWIFHDVENRLPHAIKLVNAVKSRYSFPYRINNEDFEVKMRCAGEEVTPDTVLRHFIRKVASQGEIGANNIVNLRAMKGKKYKRDYLKEDPVDPNERDKLIRFLENGDFYDVVVRIEGKVYKLHRCKLLSESGYFADVFSSEICETTDDPNKDEEYLLNVEGVDQYSFDISIRYIYHRKLELNFDTIVGVLKTACALKIVRLVGDCESWIIKNLRKMSFEVVFEILNFIHIGDLIGRFEHMYKCLLCQRILTAWSAVEDFSSFCAISIDMLEDLLITSEFPIKVDKSSVPKNFCCDNPDKLLDICSKWVIGDVQNRYHFIPRIAFSINCHIEVNFNDYKTESIPDLTNCSEQFIRDQLLKVLLSNPLIARDTMLENTAREIKDNPMFVASSSSIISILNVDMEEIVSLWLFKDEKFTKDDEFEDFASATQMGDNLYIAVNVLDNDRYRIFFQAYNISSKKFTSLAYLPARKDAKYYELYNYRNDIYACFYDGVILKYVMHLNRWTKVTERENHKSKRLIRFTSDGRTLYRLYETIIRHDYAFFDHKTNKFFETYDFDQKSWIPVPEMTILLNDKSENVKELITMNNGDIGACFTDSLWIFVQSSRNWRQLPLPTKCRNFLRTTAITHWKDKLLLQVSDEQYYYQLPESNQSWQVKKTQSVRLEYNHPADQYFRTLKSIHRPIK